MRFIAKHKIIYLPLILGLFISGVGCQGISQSVSSRASYKNLQYEQIKNGGWLTVFLTLKEATGPQVTLQVSSVEIQAGETWLPLNTEAVKIDAAQIRGGQIFVARNMLHAGEYGKLRFILAAASLKQDDLAIPLNLVDSAIEMELPASIELKKGSSKSLFVSWDVQASLVDRDSLKAEMTASLQAIPLLDELSFVACPDIDTVYAIRTDRNWVISSIGIQGRPTYLDVDTGRNLLYVLAKDESSILVYDLNTNSITDKYYIAMENKPSFMFLSPDRQTAYLLDRRGKGIAKVNLRLGTLENKITLVFQPDFGFYIENQGRLAISAPDTNKVYLLNPDSLLEVQSFQVGNYPQGLASFQDVIFVAERSSSSITSYNLVDGKQRNRINVQFPPNRLLIKNNRLYSTNLIGNSVTVFSPAQLTDINYIPINGKPLEIASIQKRFYIYVGNDDQGGLSVIDLAANRVSGFVELAASPLGLTIFDE